MVRRGEAEGPLSALLPARRKPLQVISRFIRLSPSGDEISLASNGASSSSERISLFKLQSVQLGAPAWVIRLVKEQLANSTPKKGTTPAEAHHHESPSWRYLTIVPLSGGPFFLEAPDDSTALVWVVELGSRVAAIREDPLPPPTLGSFLWRRVRLRLDAQVDGTGAANRMAAMAAILRSMASEEEARLVWIRYHLSRGEVTEARELGWTPSGGGDELAPLVESDANVAFVH